MNRLFLLLALAFSTAAFADDITVTDINAKGTRVEVKTPLTLKVGQSLTYTDKFDESCNGKVVKATANTAVLDTSACANASSIKNGAIFQISEGAKAPTTTSAPTASEQQQRFTPTIDEDWYTLWGLGLSVVSYDSGAINDAFKNADDLPGVSRSTLNMDLLGFYWPMSDKKSMQGFIINGVVDSLDSEKSNETLSITQTLLAYSYHHFFGANIGDGWFLRGDAGLARMSATYESNSDDYSETSDLGFGVLGGGGYGFAIGQETRMLLGLYATYRKAEGDGAFSSNATLGFLF